MQKRIRVVTNVAMYSLHMHLQMLVWCITGFHQNLQMSLMRVVGGIAVLKNSPKAIDLSIERDGAMMV